MAILDFKLIVVVLRLRNIVLSLALVADKAVEDVEVGCSAYYTTFTAGIGITVDGRNTVEEEELIFINCVVECIGCKIFISYILFRATDDNIGFAKHVVAQISMSIGSIVLSYRTFPSTAIDVSCLTSLDVGR